MSTPVSFDNADIERMSEKDKAELRQFIVNEQARSRVQNQTHVLTEMCWKKCAGPVKGNTLSKTEESCMSNCVDRFLDFSIATTTHITSMRQ